MRIFIFATSALLALGVGKAPGPTLTRELAAAHLVLTPPPGWTETPVIANEQMSYDYALRCPGRRLEVRYAVRPLAAMLAEYARSQTRKNESMVDPNSIYKTLFHTISLNVSAGGPANANMADAMPAEFARPINQFPSQAVKAEFGADWGGTALLQPGPEFGQTYKHCLLIGLHKKGAADAYCFYLFDNQKDLTEVVFGDPKKAAFHSLRFQ